MKTAHEHMVETLKDYQEKIKERERALEIERDMHNKYYAKHESMLRSIAYQAERVLTNMKQEDDYQSYLHYSNQAFDLAMLVVDTPLSEDILRTIRAERKRRHQ